MKRGPDQLTLRSIVEPAYVIKIPRRVYDAAGAPRCPWEEIMVVDPKPDAAAPSEPAPEPLGDLQCN